MVAKEGANSGRLDGRVAVVTGSTSGIGLAIVERFASEGASVVVSSRSGDRCGAVAEHLRSLGHRAEAIQCDVTSEDETARLFSETSRLLGPPDIAVANAGVSGGATRVAEYELADWQRVLDTNLTGVFLTTREAFRVMEASGGNIIVVSSQAGAFGYATKGAYSASKFGARGLSHVLAEEGRKVGISVSALCPGTVDTPILAASGTVVKHPIPVESVAEAAVYLADIGPNALVRDIVLERALQT